MERSSQSGLVVKAGWFSHIFRGGVAICARMHPSPIESRTCSPGRGRGAHNSGALGDGAARAIWEWDEQRGETSPNARGNIRQDARIAPKCGRCDVCLSRGVTGGWLFVAALRARLISSPLRNPPSPPSPTPIGPACSLPHSCPSSNLELSGFS